MYLMKLHNNTRVENAMDYFLLSIRAIDNFTEDEATQLISRFDYSRKLFGVKFDGKHNWETDINMFIQSCLTSIKLLERYCDRGSIHYQNEHLWNALKFSLRLMFVKIRSNPVDFYGRNELFDIFTALMVSMHFTAKRNGRTLPGIDYNRYMDYYKMRTATYPFGGAIDAVNANRGEEDIFINYVRYIELCGGFLQSINYKSK